jgi:RNA polymerase sigma factor (sigma-70 family)
MAAHEGDDASAKPKGARVAIEDAYKEHASLLQQIAENKFNIPPEDAEGVVNEVFTSFLLRRDSIRNPRKWLIGAVCHASRAYWRDAAKLAPMPQDVHEYVDPLSPGLESRIVDRVTMARALAELAPKCRDAMRLYYAEGYSAAEIAARFKTSANYVMQMLHSGRKRAREAYDRLRGRKA